MATELKETQPESESQPPDRIWLDQGLWFRREEFLNGPSEFAIEYIRANSPELAQVIAERDAAYARGLEDAAKVIDHAGIAWGDQARARKSKTFAAYVIAALDLQGQIRALTLSAKTQDNNTSASDGTA